MSFGSVDAAEQWNQSSNSVFLHANVLRSQLHSSTNYNKEVGRFLFVIPSIVPLKFTAKLKNEKHSGSKPAGEFMPVRPH